MQLYQGVIFGINIQGDYEHAHLERMNVSEIFAVSENESKHFKSLR
jgi:hypothetical protein